MTTMNISLPETMKSYVDTQVETGGYSSSSEYVRDLIRRDQIAKAEKILAEKILEGINSPIAIELTDENREAYWAEKHAAIEAKYGSKN